METKKAKEPKGNPRPDPGEWFQMAHNLYRALYATKELDKTQIKLMLWVIHQTWGVKGRRSFIFTTAAAAKALDLDKAQIRRAKDTLIEAHLLLKADKDGNEVMPNKYPETWDLSILQGKSKADAERRRASLKGGTDNPPFDFEGEGGRIIPPGGTDSPLKGDGESPLVEPKPAQEANPDGPIDIDIVDIPPISPRGGRKRASEIDPTFLEAWKEYPKRTGTNSVTEAWSAFKARLEEGVSADAMLEAIPKYRKWCEAKERIGTEYVLQGASFFGPKKRGWEGDWTIPGQAPQAAKPGEVRYAQLQRRAR